MYLLYPETSGRTLEEMDTYFRQTSWIVPLSEVESISADTREQELARCEFC